MSNLQALLDKIKKKAIEESESLKKEKQLDREKYIESKTKEALKISKEIIDNANEEAKLLENKELVNAQRKARDIKLVAKNNLIEKVLNLTKENLKQISHEKYLNFVNNCLKELNLEHGELIIQQGMDDILEKIDLKNLKLSKETVDEGFVVRVGKIEYDYKFSSLINYNKDEYEAIVTKELFGEQ
ncbi:MAG: V-type ATP synthase subunit E [Peptoniphilaceae bacterium]|nr:V-type ATP synthase subunit E [Peptoniphilaceae bacterium]MDY3738647.1 V-type ATP synthase subunit E [Peptoniphilaceae bacterium]